MLDAAYAAGVRYFDAARSYGKAEAFLATWLRRRGLGPLEATVGSTWGYTYTADWRVDAPVPEVKDLSVATLRRQVAESREPLGANLLVYQIHSATLDSGVLDDPEVHEELARLRASGLPPIVDIALQPTGTLCARSIVSACPGPVTVSPIDSNRSLTAFKAASVDRTYRATGHVFDGL